MSNNVSRAGYCSRNARQTRNDFKGILAGALFIDFILLAIYAVFFIMLGIYNPQINMDREANIYAWWSSAQLLIAGLAFGLVGFRNMHYAKGARLVLCISAVFIAMSLDETAGIHEQVGHAVDLLFGDRSETAFGRTGLWFVVIGLPFVIFFGFLVVRTYKFLETVPNTVFRLAVGISILLAGALGVEAITNFLGAGGLYSLGVALEEGLEMVGGSVLLWTGITFLLHHKSTQELWNVLRPLRKEYASRY